MQFSQEQTINTTRDSNLSLPEVVRAHHYVPVLEGGSVDQATSTYAVGRWGNDVTVRVIPEA
jgi:hypothetical protein